MSFGTKISFGRLCRRTMTIEEIENANNPKNVNDRIDQYHSPEVELGDKKNRIILRHMPKEPSKIVRNGKYEYHYNEHGDCYGIVNTDIYGYATV